MTVWKRLRQLLALLRGLTFFLIFAFGLGCIFAVVTFPLIGHTFGIAAMIIQQSVSKQATGNWFPDRFPRSGVLRYDPAKAQPGYTLYTLAPDLSAHLIDMNGREVHRWSPPKEQAVPGGTRTVYTLFGLLEPQIEGGHLFPNGDLLLVYEVKSLGIPATAAVKVDVNSHVIWRSEAKVHHAIEVVGDKIYALSARGNRRPARPRDPRLRGLVEQRVVILNSEGKLLSSHSLIDAIENTTNMRLEDAIDVTQLPEPSLHANSLDVLTERTTHFIPGAKPGDVLVSLRNLNMLVVLDPDSDKIVWALRGGWRLQHDAKMLPNGHILMFDNQGNLMTQGRSRVLEIDPVTGGIAWSYSGTPDDPLDSGDNRGGAQRLANGNTLINESDAGRILEVMPNGSIAWEYVDPLVTVQYGQKLISALGLTATRYDASYLSFLGGHATAR